jgi:predicted PurR-regulated permease PerM
VADKEIKLPFYVKATILFVGLFALFTILYIAQGIIMPLIFAVIIAILLSPVVNFLVRKGIHRVIAIIITMILTVLVIVSLGSFFLSQLNRFIETWPALVDRFTVILDQAVTWISENFDIIPEKILEWIAKTRVELINTASAAIGHTLVIVGGVLIILFLIPVYVFIILFYQPLLLDFIHKLFRSVHQSKVTEIIIQIKTLIQRYLIGLVIEAAIVATLNSTALLVLGIEYAILLGIIGAFLNVIPYIGGLVAVALPMLVAIATKSSALYALYVMIAYYVIQLIDNNFIVPIIVSSKVKINALFSIIVVFVGNALWGIPGMFLSIPLLAIVKLIFDHIESLKPWGFLLGDTMPPPIYIKPIIEKIIKKPK